MLCWQYAVTLPQCRQSSTLPYSLRARLTGRPYPVIHQAFCNAADALTRRNPSSPPGSEVSITRHADSTAAARVSDLSGRVLQFNDRSARTDGEPLGYGRSIHPWAQHAANDANCLAKESGKGYWEFADYVHANQRAISGTQKDPQQAFGELDRVTLDIGKKNGVDATQLQACVKAQADTIVKSSMAEGDSVGVSATPTIFVNGQRVEGADPDQLKAALNQQLLAAGVQPPAAPAPAPTPASPPAPSK